VRKQVEYRAEKRRKPIVSSFAFFAVLFFADNEYFNQFMAATCSTPIRG
jgi:hypothetical protein